jgi:ABC-type nickel/cobalt efflux system permease component RcnA
MNTEPELLLVAAVAAVGVLHTLVPDHWVPIVAIARQRGWSQAETARAAALAGSGHVTSTLVIALIAWLAGEAVAQRFGNLVETVSSLALIGFGGWIALSGWNELRTTGGHSHAHSHAHPHGHEHDHDRDLTDAAAFGRDPLYLALAGDTPLLPRHLHAHRHGGGMPHRHWHDHTPTSAHAVTAELDSTAPPHEHRHPMASRTALLLILGSSPMVEGIPAFFAAGSYGIALMAVMATVFALTTITTYVLLCVGSSAGARRVSLGAVERYGEVLSGALIAFVGAAFWVWQP